MGLGVGFVWQPLSVAEGLLFVTIGGLGLVAHLCLIKAYETAEASLLAPFNYAKIIWIVLLAVVFFGEIPSASTLTGSAVIIASGLYVFSRGFE